MVTSYIFVSALVFALLAIASIAKLDDGSKVQISLFGPMTVFSFLALYARLVS